MELSDPYGSTYGQIAGMETRRHSVTPGSGSGGRSVGNASSRRRSRMSNPPSRTRLMPEFDAAADDGGGGFQSSSTGPPRFHPLTAEPLDNWRLSNIQSTPRQFPRLLFHGSPMRSPASDDNVIIMDGVPVGNSGSRIASGTRRSDSFSGQVLGSPSSRGSNSYGSHGQVIGWSSSGGDSGNDSSCTRRLLGLLDSGDGGSFGFIDQFAWGREEPGRMQAIWQRFSEVEVASPNNSWFSTGSYNMQGSPITRYLFPPSLPGLSFVSYTDAADTIRSPAPYFTPPRVNVSAARPRPSTPQQPETEPVQTPSFVWPPTPEEDAYITQQPETEPVQTPSFVWPPTAEEDAYITQQLYGPTTGVRRRLLVFQAICPDEGEAESAEEAPPR